jgi:SAM-dependent methyltransferase
MLQILRFNRRFYAGTVASIAAAMLRVPHMPYAARTLLLGGTLLTLFWICSSLLVSHYVYDRSPLYNLSWLARGLSHAPRRWVNIHAGLDETSQLLSAVFPSSKGEVLDIFDPREMTEQSIAEARRTTLSPARAAHWGSLPLLSDAFDVVFLMFTAHELRRKQARVELFRELARVLHRDGEVALVEHSRDWANFLAFGPGFLHFFSQRSWRQAAEAAGLEVRMEFSLALFVHVFLLRRMA